ncbi:MAG: sigma 54-interacting transcriptional regulator [Myxococcales bacterium]|nr:sigma 54-interacting transcriptional regulator [Myxococcales bacterium]
MSDGPDAPTAPPPRAPRRTGEPAAARHLRPTLLWLHGPSSVATTEWPLARGATALGRGEAADIRIEADSRVSRDHAVLDLRDGRVRITDRGSRYGTWVNGSRVEAERLADGDVLRIGDTHLLIRWKSAMPMDGPVATIVGRAPGIAALRHEIAAVASSSLTVLVMGESGVGKEVVARAIHDLSGRRGAFLALNCAAIPAALAESQLFGHVAGAFTGATEASPGLFRAADGGTLFLDEIGDMPLALQPKLLRVLEQSEVLAVGATKPTRFDARVIAATHRDLRHEVAAGRFRGDLHARISQFQVPVPPLRERREDILLLLEHAAPRHAPLAPELVAALLAHPFPYNVRELIGIAGELDIRGRGRDLLTIDLLAHRLAPVAIESPPPPRAIRATATTKRDAPPTRDELLALLEHHEGSVRAVAKATGRSRAQVYRWLQKHDIDPRSA